MEASSRKDRWTFSAATAMIAAIKWNQSLQLQKLTLRWIMLN